MVRESATVIIPSKHNTLCYASPPHRPIPGVRGTLCIGYAKTMEAAAG